MAAIYNNAYEGSGASTATESQYLDMYDNPDQLTRSKDPPKYEMPKQTSNEHNASSELPMPSNTVPNSPPKNSSNMCRLFLIIVTTFVIGCVVGGVIIHLWTRQKEDCSGSVKNLDELILASTYPTMPAASPSSCPKCPTLPSTSPSSCPTSPSLPATNTSSCKCPTVTSTSPTSVATDTAFPKDCQEVKDRGNVTSGQYMISPQDKEGSFPVYCDMDSDGGGWTVFQRREDGSVDFYLDWVDYEDGFGNVTSEHWLGNKKIYRLTAQGHYELRIDMGDFDGNTAYAKYDFFRIGNAGTQYRLIARSYSGDAGDSLTHHDNQGFSTKDMDNDFAVGRSCANIYKGAWWYASTCHESNLNGLYLGGPHESFADGIIWGTWKGYHYSLKHVEMKIRIAP